MSDIQFEVTPLPAFELSVNGVPSLKMEVLAGPSIVFELSTLGERGLKGDKGDSGGAGDFVYNETPTGLINGSNATFLTQFEFIPEKVEVFINGIKQIPIRDYQTTGTHTIQFSSSPGAMDTLLLNYIKQ